MFLEEVDNLSLTLITIMENSWKLQEKKKRFTKKKVKVRIGSKLTSNVRHGFEKLMTLTERIITI